MGYIFDGYNSLIILNSTEEFNIGDMYSRWKDWVLDGYVQYYNAFRTLGGEPISATQTIAPYFFLNTINGWKIRPAEVDHELHIIGNLYPEDAEDSLFLPTLGEYTVLITIERSSAAIGYQVTGGLTPTQDYWLETLFKNIPLQTILVLRKG